ncbi:MAG: cell division protein ZapA [Clostridia bacterium]|nr:cell division protein ZapA [Clostridia bacterium]
MKQKYTITVADMELNIISDAAPDEVENIVGMLDRRMRDINLKSPRCTKNEAAVLCALSYCSERIAMQEAFKKVEKDAFRFAGENEKLKKTIESMQEELDNLRKDAAVMRSILDRATLTSAAPVQEKPKYIPQPAAKKESSEVEQLSVFDELPKQPTAPLPSAAAAQETEEPVAAKEPIAPEAPTPVKKAQKPANKSRVGNMFDLLTFSDV